MNMRKEKAFVISFLIIACLGVIASVVSVVLLSLTKNSSSTVGVISTIVSIVLGAISIIYTFFSGQKSLETLNNMEKQYDALVKKINQEISKDNYDKENIAAVNEMIAESINNNSKDLK